MRFGGDQFVVSRNVVDLDPSGGQSSPPHLRIIAAADASLGRPKEGHPPGIRVRNVLSYGPGCGAARRSGDDGAAAVQTAGDTGI